MDGEATFEELRPPELAERVGDQPVNLSIHVEDANRRRGYRSCPILDVAVPATGGVVQYCRQAPVIDDHEQIVGEVDLYDVAGCTPWVRHATLGERDRRIGTHDAVSRDPGRLLERVDRLLRTVAEGAVWGP